MAFFGEVGKKISDAGGEVAQQTKKLADRAHLNSSISDREKRAAQLYMALGQAYYEKYENDPDADKKEIIDELRGLNTEIRVLKEEVKQLKGVTECPNCGTQVKLGNQFCPACGTRVQEEAQGDIAQARTCPKCHSLVREGNRFCARCGAKLF